MASDGGKDPIHPSIEELQKEKTALEKQLANERIALNAATDAERLGAENVLTQTKQDLLGVEKEIRAEQNKKDQKKLFLFFKNLEKSKPIPTQSPEHHPTDRFQTASMSRTVPPSDADSRETLYAYIRENTHAFNTTQSVNLCIFLHNSLISSKIIEFFWYKNLEKEKATIEKQLIEQQIALDVTTAARMSGFGTSTNYDTSASACGKPGPSGQSGCVSSDALHINPDHVTRSSNVCESALSSISPIVLTSSSSTSVAECAAAPLPDPALQQVQNQISYDVSQYGETFRDFEPSK
ncbi:unnamed protein product [Adineta steineri]|uniref:Uncharacterized protein n=2 Tax=Adineta steineri TaxID=433720 RepID=A0A815MP03_9BILA|nr:unnamed protein product [Adineta steineri]CAF3787958.1 unnamed protein product [Adineta steineri]